MARTINDVPIDPQMNLNYYLSKYTSGDDFTDNPLQLIDIDSPYYDL